MRFATPHPGRLPNRAAGATPALAPLAIALLLVLVLGAGCSGVPTREAQRAWVQEGFGRRYTGDISKEYYIGINDRVAIESVQYPELQMIQEVRPDGKITIPMVGDVRVAGLTTAEVKDKLTTLLEEMGLKLVRSDLTVIVPFRASKRVFITGQAGRVGNVQLRGDQTIMDVLSVAKPTRFADLDDVRVIRGDPENPEVITVNMVEIMEQGLTRTNIQLKEDDIIYVPPTNIGRVAMFLDDVLFPLKLVANAFGAFLRAAIIPAQIEAIDEISDRIREGNIRGGRGGFVY